MKTNEKDTKQRIVPALRFPEFSEAGEWEEANFGQITYKVSKKNKAGKLYPIYSINNKQGFIRQEEQFAGMGSNDRGYDLSLYNIVGNKTFAYNPARINVGSIGYSGDLKDIIISSLYVCFKTCETVNDEFLLKYFETESFNKTVLNSVEGGIRSYLFYDNFAKINLYLPPNYDTAEQQKIAECLASIDALIKAVENKMDELKAHKKGLMQQLFPAKGKTVPALRFPEFQNAGEWEQTTIGAICTISNGNSNVQDNVQNGKYPLFDRSEIIKASNKFLFDCEAIIIPGEGRFIPKHYIGKFDLHQRAYALKDFICHALFVYHYITAFSFILTQKAVKSTVLSLRMPILEAFPLLLPNIQEQKKIADCLSSVDNLITAQTNRLKALKAHKKGLMQQLFPNIEEC